MKPLFVETIKLGEVEAAQEAWCDALVAISRAHAKGGLDQSKPLAGQVIDGAYGYQYGPVAFKPTWAKCETTFRKTRAGAVSYFVGDNAAFDDLGSAWNPWSQAEPLGDLSTRDRCDPNLWQHSERYGVGSY